MKIARETWIITAIGLVDLATTIIFIRHYGAEEANPLFRRYWEMGLLAFIAAKIVTLVGPLAFLEWARKHRPRFVLRALRGAIAAYLIFYGVGIAKLNGPTAQAEEVAQNNAPWTVNAPWSAPMTTNEQGREMLQRMLWNMPPKARVRFLSQQIAFPPVATTK